MDNTKSQPEGIGQSSKTGDLVRSSSSASTADELDTSAYTAAAIAVENQSSDDDVLAAISALSPETLTHIESVVDQLTSSTDLFDVSALNFDGDSG